MMPGKGVEYIFTNSRHANPLYRVAPRALIGENVVGYDKEKYRDMLLKATETVLSIFGFNRTAYGDAPKNLDNLLLNLPPFIFCVVIKIYVE